LACKSGSECPDGLGCCLSAFNEEGGVAGTHCDTLCNPLLGTGPLLCEDSSICQLVDTESQCVSSAMLPNLSVCD
ncbi:MAG: hypothetical protein ABW321_23920, partial [Polyangiales bacterium]